MSQSDARWGAQPAWSLTWLAIGAGCLLGSPLGFYLSAYLRPVQHGGLSVDRLRGFCLAAPRASVPREQAEARPLLIQL